jgi:lincosamide nucleotidyltransferase A/C/D/E
MKGKRLAGTVVAEIAKQDALGVGRHHRHLVVDDDLPPQSAFGKHNWTVATMKGSDVVELLEWLEQHGIDVWLNGGWGIDALLGHQTREHEDLDITIPAADRAAYTSAMLAAGFTTYRVDNAFNWVLIDARGRLIDVHLVDFSETLITEAGVKMYGPAGLPFEVGSLEGRGIIAGKPVRCETAEFQVRGHTTYTPDELDYRDVLALCRAFDLRIPAIFEKLGFHRPEPTPER